MRKTSKYTARAGGFSLSMLNPFSNLMGQEDRYFGLFLPWFRDDPMKAHLLEKSLFLLGLGYGGTKLFRKLQNKDADELYDDDDNPAKNKRDDLSTTIVEDLSGGAGRRGPGQRRYGEAQAKRASAGDYDSINEKPGAYTLGADHPLLNTALVGIPLMAAVGGIAAGNKSSGKRLTRKRVKTLDEQIALKRELRNRIVEGRARLAKGNLSDEELEELLEGSLVKRGFVLPDWIGETRSRVKGQPTSGKSGFLPDWFGKTRGEAAELNTEGEGNKHPIWTALFSAPFILAAGAAGLAGIAAFNYFDYNDLENIQHRAAKKAVNEYARQKTRKAPIHIYNTAGDSYFENIDRPRDAEEASGRGGGRKQGDGLVARDLPELSPAKSPLTVTV